MKKLVLILLTVALATVFSAGYAAKSDVAVIEEKDVKSAGLYKIDGEKIKDFSTKEIKDIVKAFNKSKLDDGPFIEMITGSTMKLTLKDGTAFSFISYGSETNVVASRVINGNSTTYHLISPEIAKLLLGQ